MQIPVDDPEHFTTDTPTAKLIRQALGAVAEFEKASLVAKLKGARDRKAAQPAGVGAASLLPMPPLRWLEKAGRPG